MLFVWFCVFVSAFIGRFVTEHSLVDGGFQDVPVNRTDVLEAAQFAVVEFNKLNTEDVFNYAILNTISAKMQVVGGFNYFLEMLLGRATCKTAANDCDSNSEPKASDPLLPCGIRVYFGSVEKSAQPATQRLK
ncbi:cystatin-C [Etheostoma spectabile]|uniref:cystatin-C n=1 Tax=Etheostoma spectabile TaxID=54343 RepID=UPI0013AFB2C4|nr:cystatin-C-like [Etheostoma spectabile]